MNFDTWNTEVTQSLSKSLNEFLPQHKFSNVIKYSVFPTGKLFRPMLVYSLANDLGHISENHKWLAMAIELHHTYTLIHDDLPAMDNDDYRRGRLSSHKKFSEFEAILAGDGLLNISYEYLAQIDSQFLKPIMQIFTKSTGARGLILGQIKDLANENQSFENLLEIHQLKTGELIQLCLCASAILSNKKELIPQLYQLGMSLGINFQLLDDLCELADKINTHEAEINPFLKFNPKTSIDEIIKNASLIRNICDEFDLKTVKCYINTYLKKTKLQLNQGLGKIHSYVDIPKDDLQSLWTIFEDL